MAQGVLMPKQAFITLYFNAEDYEREMGDGSKLDDKMLFDFGKDLNDQAAHFLGYEGWICGWANLPDKPKTVDELAEEAKALDRTHHVHLTMKSGRLSGIVADRVSGTEFDVGVKEEMGEILYYANDDDGTYYFGSTLTEALEKGYNAQKEN
jgi:hypothetical protein